MTGKVRRAFALVFMTAVTAFGAWVLLGVPEARGQVPDTTPPQIFCPDFDSLRSVSGVSCYAWGR